LGWRAIAIFKGVRIMSKIYKRTDRIKLQIDDLVVTISPLSIHIKTEAAAMMAQGKIKADYALLTNAIILMIKHSVKNIEGLKNHDGSDYKVELEDNCLKDETIEDLFNIEMHKKLTMICSNLMTSIPDSFIDERGNKIEGVEVLSVEGSKNPN
jgi:hypothetical protein